MIREGGVVAPLVLVEIWSDVVCPWCYIGKRRFEKAVASFGHPIEVNWRSYELDPSAPPEQPESSLEAIARKYGMTVSQAEAGFRHVTDEAAGEGLEYHLDRARSGSSFDAHRILHLARERGLQDAVKERLMAGYHQEGVAIGLPEELAPLAVSGGLDPGDVAEVLASDKYADEVRADEARARQIGITGVPFFVIDGRLAMSGAQKPESIRQALDEAWRSHIPAA